MAAGIQRGGLRPSRSSGTYIKPEDVLTSASRSREMSKLRHWELVTGRAEHPGEPGSRGHPVDQWTICPDPRTGATSRPLAL